MTCAGAVGPWDTYRNAIVADSLNNANFLCRAGYYSNLNWYCDRQAFVFDTLHGGIPPGSTISSCNLMLYVTSAYWDINNPCHFQFEHDPLGVFPHNPVVVGDYDRTHYSGNGGGLTLGLGVVTLNAYNPLTLDPSWINLLGDTKFMMMEVEHDINDTDPFSDTPSYWNGIWGDGPTVTNPPKIEITYTTGSGATPVVANSINLLSMGLL